MPNGDIVSGCSDGIIRVFSEKEEHWASAEVLKEYEEKVASQALPSQQVGDLNKEQLEGPESLNTPGKPTIQIHMVHFLFSCF
jgi:phospholipase A-2-activating protein